MSELKFVSRDGDYLVFEGPDGQRHRALVEENLRDALRRNHLIQTSDVSPAEIQRRVRAGETATQIAAHFGIPVESVEPFAIPILDELRYVLQSAQSVLLADGNTMIRFEELVERSMPNPNWNIHKEEGRWLVNATANGQTATWHYTPSNRTLDPIDQTSKSISRMESRRADLIPPRSTIAAVPESEPISKPLNDFSRHPAATTLENADQKVSVESQAPIVESTGASVLDLVAQLRQRRTEETKPSSAKGRSPLPSWDEIVSETSSESDSD